MEKRKKYARIPVNTKTIEPQLFSMIFVIENIRYIRVEAAFNLEGAVKKTSLLHNGRYITPQINHVVQWIELSVTEIKNKFKTTQ